MTVLPFGKLVFKAFQPPVPLVGVQEVAFWVAQLSVVLPPSVIVAGVAVKLVIETVPAALTVKVTLLVFVSPTALPLQVSVNWYVPAVEAVTVFDPLGRPIAEPDHPPTPLVAEHETALAVFQLTVVDPPASMVLGETVKLVIATLSPVTTGVTV